MRQNFVPFALLALLILAPLSGVSARTVHETTTVDLLPQGEFNDAGVWTLDAYTSFSEESALYTESMVADSRLTMVHERPVNLDQICLLYTSPSPRDAHESRMPSSA